MTVRQVPREKQFVQTQPEMQGMTGKMPRKSSNKTALILHVVYFCWTTEKMAISIGNAMYTCRVKNNCKKASSVILFAVVQSIGQLDCHK